MKIYLAGPCDTTNRTIMMNIATALRSYHYEVYCPWELKIDNAWDMPQEDWAQKVFVADVKAIDQCQLMVLISFGRNSTAGTNWEQGYAYAQGKEIIVFQITNADTSLMTFWGCSDFFNITSTNNDEIVTEIMKDFNIFVKDNYFDYSHFSKCTTRLT